jgi:polyhydroxybutyrate depolymerase
MEVMYRFGLAFLVLLLFPSLQPFMALRALGIGADSISMPTITDFNKLLEPGRHRVIVRIDDHNRNFIFITPKGFKFGEQKYPIVFFLHGAGGTAEQASRTYGWSEKADAEHFFAAFPEGLPVRANGSAGFLLNPHIWRDERAGLPAAGVDDVHFIEELLNKLEAVLPIDQRRIYVTGFSNGAGMTFTLGAHFSDRIAAIAPVSSQSFIQMDALARPLPVYYLTGMADPLIPYQGGTVTLPWGNSRTVPPVQETVDLWAHLNGCPPEPQVVSDHNGVRVLRYGPGRDHSEVLFTTIEGNGHHWPGSIELLPPAVCGPTLDPFNATDLIWDFFKKHPLTK